MKPINIIKLISAIVICQLAGFIGSIFTTPAIAAWYASINKPSFNPPNWIFSPVWISLFVLMGIALYLVWKKGFKSKQVKIASSAFGTQLFLNVIWSVLFFGLKSPFYAFIEICILWIAIMFTIIKFYKISKIAAYLLLPYIIWVSFAAVLNFAIFWINL
jgi:tryptophan-rich sensory protein